MSGLREALEKLAGEMEYDSSDGGAKIREVLAAHPVEPAMDRQPSDAAVAAARKAHTAEWRRQLASPQSDASPMRAALEAAYRVDVPRPVLDREAVAAAVHDAMPFHSHAWKEARRCGEGHRRLYYTQADAVLALLNGAEAEPECDCRYGHQPQFTKHEHTCSWGRWHLAQQALNGPAVDSSLHTCPGCGVKVIGHERCGDPTRPECAS